MIKKQKNFILFTFLAWLTCLPLHALEVGVQTPGGEVLTFELEPGENVENLMDRISAYLQDESSQGDLMLNPWLVQDDEDLVCKAKQARNYYAPLPDSTVKDIRFIVLTLGNEPLVKLKKYKNPLKSAGDRLENIHPLNVWKVIFTNNDTISAMHSIKRRRNVWKSFMKGMAKSLQEASERNNIKPEFIEDFAQRVGINSDVIAPSLSQENWSDFVKQLLLHVPREGNHERYDQ